MSSTKSSVNIAILVSWRFECLNVLLDILKSNFKEKYITHVFCNLNKEEYEIYQDELDHSNIDFLHLIHDEQCRSGVHSYGGFKQESKRRQPLDAFINIMSIMSQKEIQFIYTECDLFPIDEKSYLSNFKKLNKDKNEALARQIPVFNSKMPYGYGCPSPVYVTSEAAKTIAQTLYDHRNAYLGGGSISFEGMLGHAFKYASEIPDCSIDSFSEFHTGNKTYDHNLCPETMSTHQHNVFNLANSFRQNNIVEGKWIKRVLDDSEMKMAWPDQCDIPENVMIKDPAFEIKMMKKWDE